MKEKTQEAEIIERAQIDIIAAQAENDVEVTVTKLKEIGVLCVCRY